MKGVFGVGILLLGFTIGYLVLAGKLPAAGNLVWPAASPQPGSTNGLQSGHNPSGNNAAYTSNRTDVQLPSGQGAGGPTGLPTMQHLQDVNASLGGMR